MSIPGSQEVYDSSFIIGQEPDSLRGGYSESQGFPGDIAELNIWDKVLEESLILKMAKCSNAYKGNVFMWLKEKLDINKAKTINVDDLSMFCQKKSVHAIFPEKMTFNALKYKT